MKITKNRLNYIKKAVLITLLLILPFCNVFADSDFISTNDNSPETVKLVNQIFLDSSQINPPHLVFPSPSEYKTTAGNNESAQIETEPENTYSPMSNSIKLERKNEDNSILPWGGNNAFAPPSEYTQKIPYNKTKIASPNNEEYYQAFAESDDVEEEINFEGRIVQGTLFKGLNLVKEDIVLSQISTRSGSAFNAVKLQQDLQNIYSTGYFTDCMSVVPDLNDDGSVELTFILEENVTVNDVKITGNTVFKDSELLPFVAPLKNLPQNLNLINDSISKINKYYQDNGYILAAVTQVDDNAEGVLTLGISEGVINKINFEGNNRTKDYVIDRNIMTKPGSIYNEEYMKKDLSRVFSTQIFEEVNRKIEPCVDKDGEYVVTIQVKEDSSNSVSIGGGIDNALGVFGSVGYHEKNFLGRGQRVSLNGMVGSGILLSDASIKNRMNYNVELSFFEPYFLNADNSLTSKIFYRDLGSYQVPLAIERRFGVNAAVEHKVKGYNNLSTNFGLGYEHIHLKEGDYNKISSLYKKNHINFSKRKKQLTGGSFLNISPGVKYSTLDDELMPRKGIIAKANFIEALGLSNSKNTNGRLAGGITRYIPVAKKSTFSYGAKAGIKIHGNDMPEVMAFRLGGPYSIRGFKMNGVGSGESFLMGSAELLTPVPFMDRFKYDILKNLRFAFFMDAGRVFDPTVTTKLYDRPLSAITAGIGLRVYIPGIGPISVDYGIPLTNPGHYGNSGGYFTFGTGGLYDNY